VKVVVHCDRCLAKSRFDASASVDVLTCRKCGRERPLAPSDAVRTENRLDLCPVLRLGLLLPREGLQPWAGGAVIVAAIAGFLYMADRNIAIAPRNPAGRGGARPARIRPRAIPVYLLQVPRVRCTARPGIGAIGPYDLGTAGRFADDYDRERGRSREP